MDAHEGTLRRRRRSFALSVLLAGCCLCLAACTGHSLRTIPAATTDNSGTSMCGAAVRVEVGGGTSVPIMSCSGQFTRGRSVPTIFMPIGSEITVTQVLAEGGHLVASTEGEVQISGERLTAKRAGSTLVTVSGSRFACIDVRDAKQVPTASCTLFSIVTR